jgi:hypothetical protein
MSGLCIWSAPEFWPKMRGVGGLWNLFRSEFACFGDWNSVFGSGAPMRQCLSDAALFQLTIGRKGHRNRRTGGLL